MANQVIGNIIDRIGTKFNLGEGGWSEWATGGRPTTNTGITPQSQAAGYLPYTSAYQTPANPTTTPLKGSVIPQKILGVTTENPVQTPPPTNNGNGNNGGGNSGGNNGGGGGLTSDILRNVFGINDPNTIASIMGDPAQRSRYESEWKGSGSGGQAGDANWGGQIDELYSPYMSALEQAAVGAESSKGAQLGGIEDQYGTNQAAIGQEEGQIKSEYDLQNQNLNESERGAYAQSLRAFNNLLQQAQALYGQGASTGGAISDLVRQEFMRTIGQQKNTLQQGQNQIGQEMMKLKSYVGQKKDQLDLWKRQAVTQINQNFSEKLQEINLRKADVEANKTRDKIAAVRDTVDRIRQIEDQDKAFQQQLNMFAMEQQSRTNNRGYMTADVAGQIQPAFGSAVQNFTDTFNNTGGNGSTNPVKPVTATRTSQYGTDQFNPLINPYAVQSKPADQTGQYTA